MALSQYAPLDLDHTRPEYYRRHPFAPLYDLTHAKDRLGFVPEYNLRHLLAGLPGFEN